MLRVGDASGDAQAAVCPGSTRWQRAPEAARRHWQERASQRQPQTFQFPVRVHSSNTRSQKRHRGLREPQPALSSPVTCVKCDGMFVL